MSRISADPSVPTFASMYFCLAGLSPWLQCELRKTCSDAL